MSRRQFLRGAGAGGALLVLPALARVRPAMAMPPRTLIGSCGQRGNVVLRWNNAALQGVRDAKLGPPMVSRALAIVHTCMYDAWAAYDGTAVGTRLGDSLRRPAPERSHTNKRAAVSFAAYRAAIDVFPGDRTTVFDPLMASLGYDPGNLSTDASTPAGVGNLAAAAVLAFRHRDGANQLGDEPGGAPGVAYADYTGFRPVNDPMDVRVPFDPSAVHDPNAWQPLRYVDGTGAVVTPGFLGAQWQHVIPFAMSSTRELRSPTGPARFGSAQYLEQAEQLLAFSASHRSPYLPGRARGAVRDGSRARRGSPISRRHSRHRPSRNTRRGTATSVPREPRF